MSIYYPFCLVVSIHRSTALFKSTLIYKHGRFIKAQEMLALDHAHWKLEVNEVVIEVNDFELDLIQQANIPPCRNR